MPVAVFSPQLQAGAEWEVRRTVFLVLYGGRDQRQRSQRRRERMGDLESGVEGWEEVSLSHLCRMT